MEKEIRIEAPEGYELDREKSTFEKIVFKQKDGLPMSWEDLKEVSGAWIDSNSNIMKSYRHDRAYSGNRNVWPTKEEAEAALALPQLLQLRNAWNGEWRYTDYSGITKYGIHPQGGDLAVRNIRSVGCVLCFEKREIAQKFLDTFCDLIETAKPLL